MKTQAYKRTDRINDLIRQVLASLMISGMKDPAFSQVTITRVDVAPDLSHAKVYFRMFQDDHATHEAMLEALKRAAGFMRQHLGRELFMKKIPQLTFRYDDSPEKLGQIEDLLERIKDES